jgi:hypothetical protein
VRSQGVHHQPGLPRGPAPAAPARERESSPTRGPSMCVPGSFPSPRHGPHEGPRGLQLHPCRGVGPALGARQSASSVDLLPVLRPMDTDSRRAVPCGAQPSERARTRMHLRRVRPTVPPPRANQRARPGRATEPRVVGRVQAGVEPWASFAGRDKFMARFGLAARARARGAWKDLCACLVLSRINSKHSAAGSTKGYNTWRWFLSRSHTVGNLFGATPNNIASLAGEFIGGVRRTARRSAHHDERPPYVRAHQLATKYKYVRETNSRTVREARARVHTYYCNFRGDATVQVWPPALPPRGRIVHGTVHTCYTYSSPRSQRASY